MITNFVFHTVTETCDYLLTDIDGGVWLASYGHFFEDIPPFFPPEFKTEADNVLRILGVQLNSLTVATAESVLHICTKP